jgi:tetratricopeptide (TPR) repeat protein
MCNGKTLGFKTLFMIRTVFRAALIMLSLSACSPFNIQGQFASGRQALIRGDAGTALSHFQRVAEQDSTYQMASAAFRQSIWTYLGRAQYSLGQYSDAKETLEKAIAYSNEDRLARLYFGLTLLRQPIAPAPNNPFTLKDVSYALTEGVAPKRIVALVAERGISFDLTKETEGQLKRSGADGTLLDHLRKVAAENAMRRKAAENPAVGAKHIASALTALRTDLESVVQTSSQGKFWDPNGEIRKQMEAALDLLSSREPDRAKIISTGEWIGLRLEEEIDNARRDESQQRRGEQRR